MEMTNLGLKIGVLNEVSSWQRCPLREVPLYFGTEKCCPQLSGVLITEVKMNRNNHVVLN
jgi:hypothetical protein